MILYEKPVAESYYHEKTDKINRILDKIAGKEDKQ